MNLFDDVSLWTPSAGPAYELTSTTGPSSGGNAIKAKMIAQGKFSNFRPSVTHHDTAKPMQLTCSFAFQKGTTTWIRVRTQDTEAWQNLLCTAYLNLDAQTVGMATIAGSYAGSSEYESIRFYEHPVDGAWTIAEIVVLIPAGKQQDWYWYTADEDGGDGDDAGLLGTYFNIAEANLTAKRRNSNNYISSIRRRRTHRGGY